MTHTDYRRAVLIVGVIACNKFWRCDIRENDWTEWCLRGCSIGYIRIRKSIHTGASHEVSYCQWLKRTVSCTYLRSWNRFERISFPFRKYSLMISRIYVDAETFQNHLQLPNGQIVRIPTFLSMLTVENVQNVIMAYVKQDTIFILFAPIRIVRVITANGRWYLFEILTKMRKGAWIWRTKGGWCSALNPRCPVVLLSTSPSVPISACPWPLTWAWCRNPKLFNLFWGLLWTTSGLLLSQSLLVQQLLGYLF